MEQLNENATSNSAENATTNQPNVIVLRSTKSMGTAMLLTFFFGCLGMLYSTVKGAIVMFFLGGLIAFFTAGFGLILVWPIQLIWTYLAVKKQNEVMLGGSMG